MINPHQASPPIHAVMFGRDGRAHTEHQESPLLLPGKVGPDDIGWWRGDGVFTGPNEVRTLPPAYAVDPATREITFGEIEAQPLLPPHRGVIGDGPVEIAISPVEE